MVQSIPLGIKMLSPIAFFSHIYKKIFIIGLEYDKINLNYVKGGM